MRSSLSIDFSIALQLKDYVSIRGRERPLEFHSCIYTYMSLLPTPAHVVEIGGFYCQSTILMACALAGTESRITTVDPIWQHKGPFHVPDAGQGEQTYEVDTELIVRQLEQAGLDHIQMISFRSATVLPAWAEPLDCVFIDAEHTYEAVAQDCQWLQHVKTGGYAMFDDWHYGAIQQAARDYFTQHPGWSLIHENGNPAYPSGWRDGVCYDITLWRKSAGS